MGCMSAIVFTCFGAAYGTAKSGVGISAMGVLRPDLIVKSKFILARSRCLLHIIDQLRNSVYSFLHE